MYSGDSSSRRWEEKRKALLSHRAFQKRVNELSQAMAGNL
jgi:hypothetical protein